MQTTVYVDILLTVNFIINYLLLLCSGSLLGRAVRRRLALAAAGLGALSTLVIFLPPLPFAVMTAYKLLVALLLVRLSFRWIGMGQYLKDVFVFFTVSFLLAGVMLAVWVNFSPGGMLCFNGVVYFNISALLLVGTTAVAYALITLFTAIFHRRTGDDFTYTATIAYLGRRVGVSAMVDTGNTLREPFSGLPVAVCPLAPLTPLLPDELIRLVLSPAPPGQVEGLAGVRLVPYSGVGSDGYLVAFKPDELILTHVGESYTVERIYIGITAGPIGAGGAQLLLPREAIKQKISTGGIRA